MPSLFLTWHCIILTATVVTYARPIQDQARQNPGMCGADDLQLSPLNEGPLTVDPCRGGTIICFLKMWSLMAYILQGLAK